MGNFAIFHCDPGTLLSLPWLDDKYERLEFLRRLQCLVRRLFNSWGYLRLTICSDHRDELLQQFQGRFFSAEKVEKNMRPLVIRYFSNRTLPLHIYGDAGVDGKICSKTTDHQMLQDESGILLAWVDFLCSETLSVAGGLVPGYSDMQFGLVECPEVAVRVGDDLRRYPYYRSWGDLCATLGLVDLKIVNALCVSEQPKFGWENKTGHGATRNQKKVVVRTARKSRIVVRSQTTYQNPQGGIGSSSIRRTASHSDFEFVVMDGDNVLRGVYVTKAGNEEESRIAYILLQRALSTTFGAGLSR